MTGSIDSVTRLRKLSHLGQIDQIDQIDQIYQIDQIDHDLDHVDLSLPLSDVVQDLYNTYPTQETWATVRSRSRRTYSSHPATWARSYRSYR